MKTIVMIGVLATLGAVFAATEADAGWFWNTRQQRYDRLLEEYAKCANAQPDIGLSVDDKVNVRRPSALQMADETVPSEAEAQAVRTFVSSHPCRDTFVAALRADSDFEDLGLAANWEIWYLQVDTVWAKLITREITWGNANRLWAEAFIALSNRLDESTRNDPRNAEVLAHRRAAQQQPPVTIPYPAPTIHMTTCSWAGGQLYCTTH